MTLLLTIVNNLNENNYRTKIYNILNHVDVSIENKVQFALHCAKDLDIYYDNKKYSKVYETRQKCLELIGNWIIDHNSVTNKQLKDAAAYAAAYAAADAAANAADAAANAAGRAAANAADAAAYAAAYAAARAAAYAADAAADAAAYAAARAAANAAYAREEIQKKNFNYLLDLLNMNYKIFKLVG